MPKRTKTKRVAFLSPRESETLEWCYGVLDGDEIEACNEMAAELARPLAYAEKAADLLVPLLVKLIVENAERRLELDDEELADV